MRGNSPGCKSVSRSGDPDELACWTLWGCGEKETDCLDRYLIKVVNN